MDFDWFFYASVTLLNMSEEEFWRSTPKKVSALYKIHRHFNKWDEGEGQTDERVYTIDQLPFL